MLKYEATSQQRDHERITGSQEVTQKQKRPATSENMPESPPQNRPMDFRGGRVGDASRSGLSCDQRTQV